MAKAKSSTKKPKTTKPPRGEQATGGKGVASAAEEGRGAQKKQGAGSKPKKSTGREKKPATKKTTPKKSTPAAKKIPEVQDIKFITIHMEKIEKKLEKMEARVEELKTRSKENEKKLATTEKKLETRIKREEILMAALGISNRTKKGDPGKKIAALNTGLLKTEEYLLHTGKRIDNILNAVKNHREYLVKLNSKVNKVGAKEKIEMELDIMSNTLSIMMLNGFDFDKSLIKDIERTRKEMEKKDAELGKLKKRMGRLERKFEEELERFDFSSIYSKKKDIPGYR